jgi:hypothetical protein
VNVEAINNPIMPSQFEQIRLVYEAIVASPWFYDSADTREDCADLVMRQYRKGTTDPSQLLQQCVEEARPRFEVK